MDLLIATLLAAVGSAALTWFVMTQAQRADQARIALAQEQKFKRLHRRCENLQSRLTRTELEARLELLKELARFLLEHGELRGSAPIKLRDFERRLLDPVEGASVCAQGQAALTEPARMQ